MTQTERRLFLIKEMLHEQPEYRDVEIPVHTQNQKNLLRSLFNIRMPKPVSEEFRRVQDEYLRAETAEKGITDFADFIPVQEDLYLWLGDITTLKCDAIVNAANSQMLGCFCPCHGCIDNAIHTFSGVQLRLACAELMREQGQEEPAGKAKITPAYNLPCKYVLHTVGPIILGRLTKRDEELLASCYHSCLELAEKNGVESIAFCCISTGEFHFPKKRAAEIAVELVKDKDYFVLTTNVDHQFQLAGFDKKRLFYTQGDYGLWQCGKPCHQKTYDNEEVVREMIATQADMKIPTELIPKCPICGAPMTMNLRSDNTFVQDEGWYAAANRYNDFIRRHENLHILYLELGVGANTPAIIKYPFWQMTAKNPKAVYACVNQGEAFCPKEITDRSIVITTDAGEAIGALLEC